MTIWQGDEGLQALSPFISALHWIVAAHLND